MLHYIDEAIASLRKGTHHFSCTALQLAIFNGLVEEFDPFVVQYQEFTCRNGTPEWWNRWTYATAEEDRLSRIAALEAFKEHLNEHSSSN